MSNANITEINAKNIIKMMPNSLMLINPNATIDMVNPAMLRLLGLEEAELLGKPVELIFGEGKDMFKGVRLNDLLRTGFIGSVKATCLTKGGNEIYVLLSASVMRNNKGEVQGIICVAHDITEYRHLERELEKAKETVEDIFKLRADYLANMGHEMRSHMHSVIGTVNLLLDTTKLEKEQRQYVETARHSSELLLILINDLFDFFKIEAGKLEIETIDFDLRITVESIIELLSRSEGDRGLELACIVHSNVPSLLRGDPGRLRQILTNLVTSVIKFTESGEVLILCSLFEETDTHVTIHFAVASTGKGIPKDEVDNLFEPFLQEDAASAARYGMTGLGLTISKQICELMGGAMGVESEEGKGSTLWFNVVLEKQKEATPPLPLMPECVNGLRVLVVVDKEVNRRVLSNYMYEWGCTYYSTVGLEEALHVLRASGMTSRRFQLILVDVQMPGNDIEAFARSIKKDPLFQAVPIILLTSMGKRGDAARMYDAGFDAFLTKPIKEAQLFDCVSAIMGFQTEDLRQKLITKHSLMESTQQKRVKILLVEDSIVGQKIGVNVLEKEGFMVDVAVNGLEAVKAFQNYTYDIVLMDWQMPIMDGIDATREIRRLEASKRHTPIILLTASIPKEGDREQFFKAGMDDFLDKPYTPKDLIEIVNKWLSGRSALADLQDVETGVEDDQDRGAEDVIIDEESAIAHLDNDLKLLRKLGQLFLEESPILIAKIQQAILNKDAKVLRRLAHTLKGSAGNICARATFNAALKLEMIAKEGDMEGAETGFRTVVKEIERLKPLLKTLGEKRLIVH